MSYEALSLCETLKKGLDESLDDIRQYTDGLLGSHGLPLKAEALRPIMLHRILMEKFNHSALLKHSHSETFGLRITRAEIESIFPHFAPDDGKDGWLYFYPLTGIDPETHELVDRINIHILSEHEFKCSITVIGNLLSTYNNVAEGYKHIYLSIIQCLETLQ